MLKRMLGWLTLNPRSGLERQPLFWICILMPIIIALGLGAPIWIKYNLEFTEKAYSTFMEISKLPLGVTSLAIPLAVLIGKLHGAKQTAEQILNTQKQIKNAEKDNQTKLYLAHYEHFIDHFNSHILFKKSYNLLREPYQILLDRKQLYQNLYPRNGLILGIDKGDDRIANDALLSCSNIIRDCLYLIESSHSKKHLQKVKNLYSTIDSEIHTLEDHLSLKFSVKGRQDENQTWLQFIAATVEVTINVLSSVNSFDSSFYSDGREHNLLELCAKKYDFDNILNQLDILDEAGVNDLILSLKVKEVDFTKVISPSN
ncbi:hypothetical protein RAX51_001851 [Vibrio fluvialis]|nr:hypothetical protein [Vibrio fluvialis]